jgi:hypothetical protein
MGQDMTDLPPIQPSFEEERNRDRYGDDAQDHVETLILLSSTNIVRAGIFAAVASLLRDKKSTAPQFA